jgi:hypothetical protein
MLWKTAALGDEKGFMTIKANPGGTQSVTTGWPVVLALGTAGASFDGTQAVVAVPGTTLGWAWIGVAYKDLAANSYGLIQNFGPTGSILLSNSGTSLTINMGDPLVPAPAGFYSAVVTHINSGFKYVLASNIPLTTTAVAYASGYVRCV